jgi:hypothetical protein
MGMDLAAKKASLKIQTIEDKVEATFGPNPCQQLHLQTNTGDHLYMVCNLKRCIHCGPRKKATFWEQTKATLGANVYVTRIKPGESLNELTRGLERAKKESQRNGIETPYAVVGDDTLGRIVISEHPIHPNQRRMDLDAWRDRILDLWHHSVERLRRSRIFGSVSLVTLKRKGKSGQGSPWWRRSVTTDLVEEAETHNWADMLAEVEWREGVLLRHDPHPVPDMTLPVPF